MPAFKVVPAAQVRAEESGIARRRRRRSPALLAVGAGLSTWQAVRATRAEARAKLERANATANYELARGAVDSYLNAITEDPDLNRADFFQLRGKLLETAMPFYQSLIHRAPGDRRQEAEHARAYDRLGLVYFRTGATEAAHSNYRQAQAILERLVADRDGNAHRESLVVTHEHVGLALMELGRLAEAEAEYRRAVSRSEEFAALASSDDHRWGAVTARARGGLATVLDREGNTVAAEANYRRAYESSRSLAAQQPEETSSQADLRAARRGTLVVPVQDRRHARGPRGNAADGRKSRTNPGRRAG